MDEDERFLIAVIVGILLGTSTDQTIDKDLQVACSKAGFTTEYLLSVCKELES